MLSEKTTSEMITDRTHPTWVSKRRREIQVATAAKASATSENTSQVGMPRFCQRGIANARQSAASELFEHSRKRI